MNPTTAPAATRPRPSTPTALPETPTLLKLALMGIGIVAVLHAVAIWHGVGSHREGLQNLGRDAGPSIIAAQRVKAELAAMHAAVAHELLVPAAQQPAAAKEFDRRRRAVTEALLTAAGNITYGDAERVPIRTMLEGLGPYEGAIAQAQLLHARADAGFVEPLRRADSLLADTLLPAADALDGANREALAAGYTQARTAERRAWAALIVSGLAALAALVVTQLFLARKTRRVVNPALALATAIVLAGFVVLGSAYTFSERLLQRAKDDCFQSINVLEQARADGYDLLAAERFALVDPERAVVYAERFRDRRDRMITPAAGDTLEGLTAKVIAQRLPPGTGKGSDEEAVPRAWGALARAELPADVRGHLAVELRNITFVGERDVAAAALREFAGFVSADMRLATLAAAGKLDEATSLAIADQPGGSLPAFRAFDDALGQTLGINHAEFDKAVDRGFAAVASREWFGALVAAGIALLAYAGIRPRLREYAP